MRMQALGAVSYLWEVDQRRMVWVGHITCVTMRLYSMLATPILMVAWHPHII